MTLVLGACSTDRRDTNGSAATAGATTSAGATADAGTNAGAGPALNGTWAEGDERSTWNVERALDGFSIHEQAQFGTDGRAERTFEFDANRTPTRANERRTQTVANTDRSPEPLVSELTVDFTQTPVFTRKTVGGATKQVQPYETENLKRHALALASLARLGVLPPASPTVPQQPPDTTR